MRHPSRGLGSALHRRERDQVPSYRRLKAITTQANAGSIRFHQRLGFEVTLAEDYSGPGLPRIVMTRDLPLPPG